MIVASNGGDILRHSQTCIERESYDLGSTAIILSHYGAGLGQRVQLFGETQFPFLFADAFARCFVRKIESSHFAIRVTHGAEKTILHGVAVGSIETAIEGKMGTPKCEQVTRTGFAQSGVIGNHERIAHLVPLLTGKIDHAFEQMLDVRIGDEKDARHAQYHAALVMDSTVNVLTAVPR